MHGHQHTYPHTQVASLDWSCRKLICTTLKCISIKEKHIEVPGEERREKCERTGGRNGVWNIVCESMRVIEGWVGGGSSTVFGKGRREGERKREGESVFISLSWKNISFWDESDLERVLGGWGTAKILTNFNLVISSSLVLCQHTRAVPAKTVCLTVCVFVLWYF